MKKTTVKLFLGLMLCSLNAVAGQTYATSEAFSGDAATIQTPIDLVDHYGRTVAKAGEFVRIANDSNTAESFCKSKRYQSVVYMDITQRGSMCSASETIGLQIHPQSGAQSLVEYYDPYVKIVEGIVCGNPSSETSASENGSERGK